MFLYSLVYLNSIGMLGKRFPVVKSYWRSERVECADSANGNAKVQNSTEHLAKSGLCYALISGRWLLAGFTRYYQRVVQNKRDQQFVRPILQLQHNAKTKWKYK